MRRILLSRDGQVLCPERFRLVINDLTMGEFSAAGLLGCCACILLGFFCVLCLGWDIYLFPLSSRWGSLGVVYGWSLDGESCSRGGRV